ncbi:beta-ketoacyl synthase-like protein [Chromohalobacter marismortui]|uniref:Beta-ketoacyl synthase-like protein n=1 Tax=Chromohalobacter marismortui TaxID=42055 RepID=A0A4R7NM18_9GAMM|nr:MULTISPECIES: beta-ketoacyl synthase chain length factor [Chromohalobacter]MCI0510230.1 beta-ketoacyl synthase chain length factor [Chromohalobacter sp.]MCI0593406.1 beta-ketoacyl synthase chain length factor [Chromohalobacter sp.]TDU21648.1 beta-ketoacyl synthase-like protein [Chromohalobacter marismortui]
MTTPAMMYVHDWRAWQPGRRGTSQPRISIAEKPAGGHVPAMLRRRLTGIGRALCDMLAELDVDADCPLLYASRHGDGERTLEMLNALAEEAPLSPARFGLSVHNAIPGVYSIGRGNRRTQQAIAASGDEFAALLADARGYLAQGEPAVIVAFADQAIPERFAAHFTPPVESAAVALRLSLTPAQGAWALTPRPLARDAPREESPQPSDLIDWLCGTRDELHCQRPHQAWSLVRAE